MFVAAVELLLAVFGSFVVVATLTMFVTVIASGDTCRTSSNVAEAPAASEAMVQVTLPEQTKAGPLVCVIETKVVPAGTGSASETFAAADGPLFVTVMV